MAQVEAIDFSPIAKLGEQAMEFSQRGQLRDIHRERLALAQQRQMQDIALRQQQEARQAETAKVDLAAKEFKNRETQDKWQQSEALNDYAHDIRYQRLDSDSKKLADEHLSANVVQSAAGDKMVKKKHIDQFFTDLTSVTDLGIEHHTVLRNKADMAFGEAVGKLPKLREDAASGDPMAMAKLMKAEQEAEEFGAKALAANNQVSALMAQMEKDKKVSEGKAAVQKILRDVIQDDPELLQKAWALSPGFIDLAVQKGDPAMLQTAFDKVQAREEVLRKETQKATVAQELEETKVEGRKEVKQLGAESGSVRVGRTDPLRSQSKDRKTDFYGGKQITTEQARDIDLAFTMFDEKKRASTSKAREGAMEKIHSATKDLNELVVLQQQVYAHPEVKKSSQSVKAAIEKIREAGERTSWNDALKMWNFLKINTRKQISDPVVAKAMSKALATADVLGAVYQGTGQLSDQKLKLALELLDLSYSPEAFKEVVSAHQDSMSTRIKEHDRALAAPEIEYRGKLSAILGEQPTTPTPDRAIEAEEQPRTINGVRYIFKNGQWYKSNR